MLDARLTEAADRFGTPAYIYATDIVEARLADLRAHLGRWFAISFAVKSNPNPALLGWMRDRLDYLDISSGGELVLGRQAGWDPARISFTGPAKQEFELRDAVESGLGELVLESLREAELADRLAAEAGRIQPVLIRIAPDRVPKGFGDQMAGRPSPFGIDVEDAAEILPRIAALPNLRIIGLHIYSGTQSLKSEAICENWRIFMQVFSDICTAQNLRPEKLIFGAGLGIPYHPGDQALDLAAIAAEIGPALDTFRADPRFADTKLVLELGRYLVGPAGWFVTRVVSVKQSRGTRIANTLPRPTCERTPSGCASTCEMRWQIDNPSPSPRAPRSPGWSKRWNSSKIWPRCAGGMPGPVSQTSSAMPSPRMRAASSTPPAWV